MSEEQPEQPKVILSAFLDEAVQHENIKDLEEQLRAGQAVGLKYWTPRFIFDPASGGNKNILALRDPHIAYIKMRSDDLGFTIGCLGTALGKEKVANVEDGNKAPYTTPQESAERLKRGLEVANMTGAKFLRAFGFYGVKGEDPTYFYQQALDRVGTNVELCAMAGVIYLMEIEAGLVVHNAESALRMCDDVKNPYLLVCPDAANSHVQGDNAFEEYKSVAEAGKLGYMHIKDYTADCPQAIAVDEEALRHFGSVDVGRAHHREIFQDLSRRFDSISNSDLIHMFSELPPSNQISIDAMLKDLGAPGLILDVEGHMKGGGQFGGWSGPDGLGVAVRALTNMLDDVWIEYAIRGYEDIKKK